jgi:hypothetical protein
MKRTVCLWTILLCFACLVGFLHPASAQDMAVEWVTVTPTEGEVGDTVTLQARIKNNGPGMAFSIQYGWYLSMDNEIATDGMAVGDMLTLFDYLYTGNSSVVTLATLPSTYLGDVDGRDLAVLAKNPTIMILGDFAMDFGKGNL